MAFRWLICFFILLYPCLLQASPEVQSQSVSIYKAKEVVKAGKTVRLATLEWPPYTGSSLPDLGATSQVVRKAFELAGYSVQIDVIPWNEAISKAKSGEYDGYFPVYFSRGIEQNFIFSKTVGTSPLGFADRKNYPIHWRRIDELTPFTIGVVAGYTNTEMLDQWIAEERLKSLAAPDDTANIDNLFSGKIDLAVIDPYVMQYLLSLRDKQHPKISDAIEFNSILLDVKRLFVCFRKSERGQSLKEAFDAGLSKITPHEMNLDYFRDSFPLLKFKDPQEYRTSDMLQPVQSALPELTEKERAFLKEHPLIRVQSEGDYPPFDFRVDGKEKGYSIEYLKLIAKKTGLNFKFIGGYTWAEILENMQNRKLDVIHTCYVTKERREYARFTKPYVQISLGLVVQSNSNIDSLTDLRERKLASLKGSAWIKDIKDSFPTIKIIETDSTADVLAMVAAGEVEAGIESISLITYLQKEMLITGIEARPIPEKKFRRYKGSKWAIGTRSDWPLLHSIIEKGMGERNLS